MYKVRHRKHLRRLSALCYQRRGFSLAELVVAIGVLALMLVLAGEVMSLTVRSTGQAKALTDVNQQLRILEQTLREDLKYVQRGNSLILIQGNQVNAYWTENGRDADNDGDPITGYPHARAPGREDADGNLVAPRADILMVFSGRRARSSVHPNVTSEVQQVVYGHAALGEYVPNPGVGDAYLFAGGPEAFPTPTNGLGPSVDLDEVSRVPASLWHLARRTVLLMPTPSPGSADPAWAVSLDPEQSPELLNGSIDVVENFVFSDMVLTPPPLADAAPGAPGAFPWFLPPVFNANSDEYTGWAVPFERSRLDPTPPALCADRLGHYFLPHCASFKVEWALNPRSEFVGGRLDGEKEVYWLDPGRFDPDNPDEHPLASLEAAYHAADDPTDPEETPQQQRLRELRTDPLGGRCALAGCAGADSDHRYSLEERFHTDLSGYHGWDFGDGERANLVIFGAAKRHPSGELAPEEVFPSALRITVDVYDDEGRLERPIRHVMVIPVGR